MVDISPEFATRAMATIIEYNMKATKDDMIPLPFLGKTIYVHRNTCQRILDGLNIAADRYANKDL